MPMLSRSTIERLLALSVALAVLLTITVISSTADQQQAAAAWLDNARRAAWAPARLRGARRLLQEGAFNSRWVEQLHVHGDGSDTGGGARQQVPVPLVLRLDDEVAKKADRETWVQGTPHLPPLGLEDALYYAALSDSKTTGSGAVIVTAGNRAAFSQLLPRLLRGLKRSMTGDLTNHLVVVGLGPAAKSTCAGLQARHAHQCVLSEHWSGPDSQFPQDEAWFAAAELHKLELLLNVATLGYAALWLDIDSVVFRNPLPHLLALDADLALPDAGCVSRDDRPPAQRPGAPGASVELHQASGLVWAAANVRAVRALYEWLARLRLAQAALPKGQAPQHNSDRVFNAQLAPHLTRGAAAGHPLVRLLQLSQARFPSWCAGPCGCLGPNATQPDVWDPVLGDTGAITGGSLSCPDTAVDEWLAFHYPCTSSLAEKAALMDLGLALLEEKAPLTFEGASVGARQRAHKPAAHEADRRALSSGLPAAKPAYMSGVAGALLLGVLLGVRSVRGVCLRVVCLGPTKNKGGRQARVDAMTLLLLI
ncbi:hypothetical protein WJX81_005445 [Elliptochloris bilobata]|uniref:Nucleotide-diphospho-sugar transferase domain-containing protein n=1 Tax=Elliptochloris bilobata TaxID=381761 RepID=A0AAW1QYA0_9CHLO